MVVFGFWIIVFFDFWLSLDDGGVYEFVVCVCVLEREKMRDGWI